MASGLALVLAGGAWLGLAGSAPPTVRTAMARAAPRGPAGGSVLDASGYVTARRQATVSAKITGKVTEVLIEEGMRVQRGVVLARLDDTEARAQLSLARAQLTAARSQQAEIRAQLDQAERDHTRQQELYRRQLAAAQALDAAVAQRDTLRAKLASAAEQIRVAEESVAVAQVQLDNTVIRADRRLRGLGVRQLRTPAKAPRANALAERWVRSARTECLDHLFIVDERHLQRALDEYVAYFNAWRPHRGLGQRAPCGSASMAQSNPTGRIIGRPVLGGLHHVYQHAA